MKFSCLLSVTECNIQWMFIYDPLKMIFMSDNQFVALDPQPPPPLQFKFYL